jgi:hypothetical protein
MPDIDVDFCFERRQEVIDYVSRKYGKEKVVQIVTFGTLAAKGVIRDVARVLVNGKQYGYAWTAPYEVYVPKRDLKNGSNEIQIVVANTWHNALQGAGEGKAPFKGIWTNAKYRTKSKALLPAGLLSTINIVY